MDGCVDRIKQYPAKEQAELRVRVNVPGSWFNNLSSVERAQKYVGEAVGFEAAFRFGKKGGRTAHTSSGVRFICESDVFDNDPNHSGFIMPLGDLISNRHRDSRTGSIAPNHNADPYHAG